MEVDDARPGSAVTVYDYYQPEFPLARFTDYPGMTNVFLFHEHAQHMYPGFQEPKIKDISSEAPEAHYAAKIDVAHLG